MNREDNRTDEVSYSKLQELDSLFDSQLEDLAGSEKRIKRDQEQAGFSFKKLLARIVLLPLFALLPFAVLIRTSIFTYQQYGWNGWLALGSGLAATVALLLVYLLYLTLKMKGTFRLHRYAVRGVILLVMLYCVYGLAYISGLNVKNDDIRSYYGTLHPLLRVTVATAAIADNNLVITDLQRTPDDYRRMGLTPLQQSLHYRQETGYVHAVDLRTKNRSAFANWMTEKAFYLLGFNTLRHVGTADHLHISLPLND